MTGKDPPPRAPAHAPPLRPPEARRGDPDPWRTSEVDPDFRLGGPKGLEYSRREQLEQPAGRPQGLDLPLQPP